MTPDSTLLQSTFEFGPIGPDVVTPDEMTASDDAVCESLEDGASTDQTEIRAQLRVMDILEAAGFPTWIARTGQPFDLTSNISQLEIPAISLKGLITIQVKGTSQPWGYDPRSYQFNTKRCSGRQHRRYLVTELDMFAFAPLPETSVVFRLPRDLVNPRVGGIPYTHTPSVTLFRKPDITRLTLQYCLGRLNEDRNLLRRLALGSAA